MSNNVHAKKPERIFIEGEISDTSDVYHLLSWPHTMMLSDGSRWLDAERYIPIMRRAADEISLLRYHLVQHLRGLK